MDALSEQKTQTVHDEIMRALGPIESERDVQVAFNVLAQVTGRALVRSFGLQATEPGIASILSSQILEYAENFLQSGVERQTTPRDGEICLSDGTPFVEAEHLCCGMCGNDRFRLAVEPVESGMRITEYRCAACNEAIDTAGS